MNKMLIGLVLIALLVGLGGGYVLGYVIYQPQLQSLQDDLGSIGGQLQALTGDVTSAQSQLGSHSSGLINLNTTLERIENRSWHLVWSSSGSSNVTSGNFQLKGKMFQIGWGYYASNTDCWIDITLRFQNGTICWENGSSGIFAAYDSEGPVEETGQYYVNIKVSSYVNWMVLIHDFY